VRSSWKVRRATFPGSFTVARDVFVAPLEIVDVEVAVLDRLNNQFPQVAIWAPAVGWRDSFSVHNDGPAACAFSRVWMMDTIGPNFLIDSPAIIVPAGTTLNRLTSANQLSFPTFPTLLLRFENKSAVNDFTAHVVYTLRA